MPPVAPPAAVAVNENLRFSRAHLVNVTRFLPRARNETAAAGRCLPGWGGVGSPNIIVTAYIRVSSRLSTSRHSCAAAALGVIVNWFPVMVAFH